MACCLCFADGDNDFRNVKVMSHGDLPFLSSELQNLKVKAECFIKLAAILLLHMSSSNLELPAVCETAETGAVNSCYLYQPVRGPAPE